MFLEPCKTRTFVGKKKKSKKRKRKEERKGGKSQKATGRGKKDHLYICVAFMGFI